MRAGTISLVYRTFSRGGSDGPFGLAAFLPPSCGAASGASFAAFPFFCLSSFLLTSILQWGLTPLLDGGSAFLARARAPAVCEDLVCDARVFFAVLANDRNVRDMYRGFFLD